MLKSGIKLLFASVAILYTVTGSEKLYSQSIDLDSVLLEISSQPDDSNKVIDIIQLAKELYSSGDFNRVLELCDESLILSKDIGYSLGTAETYYLSARTNNQLNNHATALEHYSKAQQFFQELNRRDRLAGLYNNVGLIYKNLGRYSNAIEFLSKSFEYYEILKQSSGIASSSNNLGSVYRRIGNYEKAAESYFRALKIFESSDTRTYLARIHQNLANLYSDQKDYNKALRFSENALKLYEERGETKRKAYLLGNIAGIFLELGRIDTAFAIQQQSYKIFEELNDQLGIASSLDNIGVLYSLKGEYNLASEAHKSAIVIMNELDRNENQASMYSNLAHALTMMEKYPEAYEMLMKGLEISSEQGALEDKLKNYKRLYELFEKQKEFNTSLKYFKQYSELKDSLFNKDKIQQIAQIEESYEIDKREKENELLRQQQATQFEVIKRQNFQVKVLISGLVIFLLFAIYYYRINQQKKRTNELLSEQNEEINRKQVEIMAANQSLQLSEQQLHQANQELQSVNTRLESTVKKRTSELQRTNHELDTFLYQSSHALRRPIVHVKGLVQLARLEPDPQEVTGLYDKLDDTATRMDLMLKKLVMASEIYVTEPQVETIHFDKLINEVWDNLTDTLKVQTVKLEHNVPNNIEFKADRKLIKIMFLNLLENAIFYNEATKRKRALVTINLANNPKSIDIKVNDNGIGISEEAIASIFDLFSVGTDKTKGYGLGLYIVKKAVEKLQGVITVSSKRNEYTTFHITLPKETGN